MYYKLIVLVEYSFAIVDRFSDATLLSKLEADACLSLERRSLAHIRLAVECISACSLLIVWPFFISQN